MINVSEALKTLYRNDVIPIVSENVHKALTLYFPEIEYTITNDKIKSESFELDEAICRDDIIRFGACEAAQMKTTVANVDFDFSGLTVIVTQTVDDTYGMPLGIFKVESCKKQDNLWFRDIIAYGIMRRVDVDVTAWYNSLFAVGDETYTLAEFRASILNYLNLEEDITALPLPNDGMIVENTIEPTKISGRTVIERCQEINGAFGQIGRDGKFTHVILKPAYGLYPSVNLYPDDNLYPIAENDTTFIQDDFIDETVTVPMRKSPLRFEEYTSKEIFKLQVRQEEGDIGAIVGGDQRVVIDTQTGTSINSAKAEEASVIITRIEGDSSQSNPNPTPDSPSSIITAHDFDIVASNGIDNNSVHMTGEYASLPNGVQDTIEVIGGVLTKVKRAAKVVLNGGETLWQLSATNTNTLWFTLTGNIVGVSGSVNLFCSHFKPSAGNSDTEHVRFNADATPDLCIWINKARLATLDVAGFISWLSAHPVTVTYELATHIYTQMDPITLQSYGPGTEITTTAVPAVNITAQFYANTDNAYVIQGNFLVYGKTATELEVIARNAFGNMAKRPHRPYTVDSVGLPYVTPGDMLGFPQGDSVAGYVFQRTLNGLQALRDTFLDEGSEELEQVFDVNSEIIQTQGKSAIIKKNVDEVSATVTSLETDVNGQITELSGEIGVLAGQVVLKVKANGNIGFVELNADPETGTNITLSANQITLEGLITANGNFKVNLDGSIEAVNGKFSGQITGGSINISGNFSVDSSGHLIATGADITGSLTSTGTYGTVTISDGRLNAATVWATHVGDIGHEIDQVRTNYLYVGGDRFDPGMITTLYPQDGSIDNSENVYLNSSRALIPSTTASQFSLGSSSRPWPNLHVNSISHKSGGTLGFYGKSPVSQITVTKLSTGADLAAAVSKINAICDALGNVSGLGLIDL